MLLEASIHTFLFSTDWKHNSGAPSATHYTQLEHVIFSISGIKICVFTHRTDLTIVETTRCWNSEFIQFTVQIPYKDSTLQRVWHQELKLWSGDSIHIQSSYFERILSFFYIYTEQTWSVNSVQCNFASLRRCINLSQELVKSGFSTDCYTWGMVTMHHKTEDNWKCTRSQYQFHPFPH